jgi:hypothetical protein
MKAIISTTYSDIYLYFLPIVTFCWNKLGVDVICFMPEPKNVTYFGDIKLDSTNTRFVLVQSTMINNGMRFSLPRFACPEHKEATYAQCARLYAACLDLPEDEILVTGDADMAMFQVPPYVGGFTIFGSDLVPDKQYPMCYISARVKDWRNAFEINYISHDNPNSLFTRTQKTYQQCLYGLLGEIEAQHFRGNYWGKDQEEAYLRISSASALVDVNLTQRARLGTQFAEHRVDRDDVNWRSYVNDDLVDAHLWRPGYTDENFANIMELLTMKYPDEDLQWMWDYRNEYIKSL